MHLLIQYSNDMDDISKNIEEYYPNKERKILDKFDDMINDMISSNKLNPILTELFISGRKLNISINIKTNISQQAKQFSRLYSKH